MDRRPTPSNPFRWFDSSPAVIQMVVMLNVRFPLSPRNVEDLAFERGIDMCQEYRTRHSAALAEWKSLVA